MTQVVLAYLAGGWMVLVVIDQVVDREVLPLVFYEATLTLYLLGMGLLGVVGYARRHVVKLTRLVESSKRQP